MEKGRCYICKNTYADRGMARHVKTCLEKVKGAIKNGGAFNDSTYLIKIQDKYDSGYYLYILADGCVLLSEIDRYLRDIWLECCGHLSGFIIDGIDYESSPGDDWGNDEDMHIEIDKVLYPGMTFSYLYDYGSTTELELKVIERYEPLPGKKGIYLVGRNLPREYKCNDCNNKAEFQFFDDNSGKEGIVCTSCMERMQSGNEEIYFSDIINSPRAGVCGYDGPCDDIMFMEHKELKSKKRKKAAGGKTDKPEFEGDRLSFVEKLLSGQLTQEDMENDADLMDMLSGFANLIRSRHRSKPPFMLARGKLDGHVLKDYLVLLRKNELDEIRKKLNIENATGLKKDELIDRIHQFLQDDMEKILAFLPSSSYTAVMEIYKTGEAFWEESEEVPEILEDLRRRGLLFSVYDDEEQYEWVIPDDIKSVINRLASDKEFQKKRYFSDRINRAMFTVFYYWGIVTRYDLMKETARLLDVSMDDEFIEGFEGLFSSMESHIQQERVGSSLYYSIYAEDAGAKILSPQWRNADYPSITKDMLPEGDEGWISLVLHNPYLQWIYDTMVQGKAEESGKTDGTEETGDDEEACEMVSIIAHTCLNAKPGTSVVQLAEELKVTDELYKVPFVQELLNNLLLYMPNYWLKGHSISGEIHVNDGQHKGWAPQNMPAEGPMNNQVKNTAEFAASRWNVGRNDPCPCGNGKKFKKCCGK